MRCCRAASSALSRAIRWRFPPSRSTCRPAGRPRALGAILADRLGPASLLPRMIPLGEADEAELDLAAEPLLEDDAEPLTAPIPPLERRLILARLVQAWAKTVDRSLLPFDAEVPFLVPSSPADAVGLAGDLERLMDALTVEGLPWSEIKEAVEAEYFALVRPDPRFRPDRRRELADDSHRPRPRRSGRPRPQPRAGREPAPVALGRGRSGDRGGLPRVRARDRRTDRHRRAVAARRRGSAWPRSRSRRRGLGRHRGARRRGTRPPAGDPPPAARPGQPRPGARARGRPRRAGRPPAGARRPAVAGAPAGRHHRCLGRPRPGGARHDRPARPRRARGGRGGRRAGGGAGRSAGVAGNAAYAGRHGGAGHAGPGAGHPRRGRTPALGHRRGGFGRAEARDEPGRAAGKAIGRTRRRPRAESGPKRSRPG